MNRSARCACGQLSVRCAGEPRLVSVCHCTACQLRTGSAVGSAAFFSREDVTTAGRSTTYDRGSDDGGSVSFRFCPDCGSTVYWYPERKPGLIAVAVGAFADPTFPAPTQQVHTATRHPWLKIDL